MLCRFRRYMHKDPVCRYIVAIMAKLVGVSRK